MTANPDLIILKHSSQTTEQIEEAISSTGSNPIAEGEIVISQETDRAYLYTKGSTGNVVRVYTGANLGVNNEWNISEDGGDFDLGSASYEQFYLPDTIEPFSVVETTPILSPLQYYDYTIAIGRFASLLKVQSNHPAWIRLYGTALARDLDNRFAPGGRFPPLGQDFWGEFVTTSTNGTITLAPVVLMSSSDGFARLRIRNMETISTSLIITLTVVSIVN